MSTETIQIQLAWFFSELYVGNFETFSQKLKTKLGESKNTQYIPVPNDAPGEIPRLILMYDNFNVNVSKSRLDFYANDFSSTEVQRKAISSVVFNELHIEIGRVGYVVNYFIGDDISTLKLLFDTNNQTKLKDAKELNVRVNKRETILGNECNVIENISTGIFSKREADGTENKKTGLIVMKDINTIPESLLTKRFTSEEFEKLLSEFDVRSKQSIFVDL